jgi:hypothetical protein
VNDRVRIRPHEREALVQLVINVSAMALVLWPTGDIKRTQLQNHARAVEDMLARMDRGEEA